MKILVVEDEKDLREILKTRLEKYYSVDACGDGEEALDYFQVYTYDMVILDIMLPKLDGISVLKHIRNSGSDVPVLLLTARSRIEDRVSGLDAGADDYLVKPFAFDELLARLRVMSRRNTKQTSHVLTAGELVMDTRTKTVKRNGQVIPLSGKEYMLLEYMMYHQNVTLTRNQLEQQAWDNRFEGGSNIVDVYIRYLRKKIDDGHEKKMIRTIRGLGYCLEGTTDEKTDDKK